MLVACDMTGSYIGHDGGHSWRMFNLRGPVRFFAFDPVDAHTIYVGTEALWRTIDNGATWHLVWPRPLSVRGVRMSSDHADETIISDNDPVGQIVALAIDPANSHALVAAGIKDNKAAVFVSKDAGNSWERIHELPSPPQKIWCDPHSSATHLDIYVGEVRGLSVRVNGKWWGRPGPPDISFSDMSAGFSQAEGTILYAIYDAGIFVSRDRGVSWTSSSLPGQGWMVSAVATSLKHPESAYVSYNDLQLNGNNWMGVAHTRDGGRTWALGWKEDATPSLNIHDAWVSQISVDWGGNPLNLGVADQDLEMCIGTDFGRTMISTDGGTTWNAAYSKRIPGGGWTSTGLDVTTNAPRDAPRKTRGQDGVACSFPVGLLHPLQHAGLSRRSSSDRPTFRLRGFRLPQTEYLHELSP